MGRGTATLLAGLGGGLALPVLALGLNLPLWLAAVLAAAVFGGLTLLLRPGGGPGLTDDAVLEARGQTAQVLLQEATPALDRLRKAAKAIGDQGLRDQIRGLASVGDKVVGEVRADPDRAMAVRRLLSFYLPNAANVAEGVVALQGRASPDPVRLAQARDTLGGLTEAFNKYADDVSQPQLAALDLDLKVLNDALKADLEKTP
jgi:hypothetical protein